MKTLLPRLMSAVLLLTGTAMAETLRMGIFPYHSPEQLVRLHKPLKDYLAHESRQRIRLLSAPDFDRFIRRTREGRYQVLITAPHLGRIAEREYGYRWLGLTLNQSRAVFVSHKDTGPGTLQALSGRRLALPPEIAIIHQAALRHLDKHGLNSAADLTVVTKKSHDAALFSVLRGEADAAAIGLPTWLRYDLAEKAALRVFAQSETLPGFALMTHPALPPEVAQALRNALYRFESTPGGSAYFDRTGLEGIRAVNDRDLEQLDRYLAGIGATGRQ